MSTNEHHHEPSAIGNTGRVILSTSDDACWISVTLVYASLEFLSMVGTTPVNDQALALVKKLPLARRRRHRHPCQHDPGELALSSSACNDQAVNE